MASTFTDLGLELMATGENAGTWGTKTNANLNLVEQLTGGYLSLAVAGSGTTALTIADGALTGTAQQRVIELTGALTGSRILTVPLLTETFYFIKNSTTNAQTLQLKAVSGSGATVTWATTDKGWKIIYVDGVATNTGVYEIPMTSVDDVTLTGTQTLTNKTINASQLVDGSIATAKLADDLVTLAKMAPGTDGNIISYDASGNPVAVATGDAGQVLTSAGAGAPPTFTTVAGRTGAVSWDTTVKTGNFTAANGVGYFVNTTSGAINVTLPAGSAGDVIAVKDYANTFDTNAVTLVRNGSDKIGGTAVNATLLTEGLAVTLVFIDATQGWLVTDSGLQSDSPTSLFVTATGGTVTCSGDYRIHTFTGPGTLSVSCAGNASGSNTVDYMVVAGGGGAFGANGANSGGGGGAGGFRETTGCGYTSSPLGSGVSSVPVSATSYPIVVGGGGAGSTDNGTPSAGSNSSGLSITSAGGGAGGPSQAGPGVGNPGGSGSGAGGGAPAARAAGSGNTPPVSPPQGSDGGARPSPTGPDHQSGGGGGATAAGTAACASPLSGVGGTGATTSIIASPTAYAGGGGGSGFSPQFPNAPGLVGNGSSCGTGGSGSVTPGGSGTGESGTTNRGGGGGAASSNSGACNQGGAGGSGVVVIRYKFQ